MIHHPHEPAGLLRLRLGLLCAALPMALLLTGCAPQIILLVAITSPNAAVVTNGTVTIQVAVEGGTPSGVSLLLDGALLVALNAPYSYAWDTVGVAEASYELTARATLGGRSFDSDPLAVTVDHTPPTVVSRTPAPGSSDVWLGEAVRVAFSEALDAATITDTTVELLDAGAASLAKTLTLEAAGDAISLVPNGAPIFPNTLSVALSSSITDLAGNALVLPAGPWSWSVDAFALFGGALNGFADPQGVAFSSLAIDADGHPVVAWPESDGSVMRVFVRRWDGAAWQPLGGPLSSDSSTEFIFVTSLKLDGTGNPVLAWDELTSSSATTVVQLWDGSAWQELGGGVSGFLPSMVLDAGDRPIVAVLDTDGTNLNVEVHHWDGAAWNLLGGPLSANAGDTDASKPALAFDGSQPLVAWSESDGAEEHAYVRRWDGAAWQALGGTIGAVANENTSLPSLATEQDGTPLVAFREDTGTDPDIFAFRWTGAAWSQLGSGFDSGADMSAGNVDLAIDSGDRPLAVWSEFGSGQPSDIFLARFDGGSWTLLPAISSAAPGDSNALVPSLALDADDAPWIAWTEESEPESIYVQGPNELP